MSAQADVPIFAHLGEREFPVRWAWYRPEPQVGDTVRLPLAPSGNDDWHSFRVIGKQIKAPAGLTDVVEPPMPAMIYLDVEPLALQD